LEQAFAFEVCNGADIIYDERARGRLKGHSMLKMSIVTPSYNQCNFIEECLGSVKAQNYSNVEHIVTDGVSTDGSVEVLRRYSQQPSYQHLRWVSEPDQGQSDALNKGFQMATGDIVGWLNSDDRYRPGCFQAVIEAFEKNPDVDVLYGDYTWIDESGHILQVRREIEFSPFVLSYHRVLYIHSTATFFRRRVFGDGNFLNTQYHYAMDYEFFLRLAQKGYRFKRTPHLLADFRWHRKSKSSSSPEKQLAELDAIATSYSRTLQRFKSDAAKKLVLSALRVAAAGLRYSEKLVRGYYLEQFRASARGSHDAPGQT
jgi:glycosyltransferase involved in cell wall biosynthesis